MSDDIILVKDGHDREVWGRTVLTNAMLLSHPAGLLRELVVRRTYHRLVDIMDETARAPEWLHLAQALQGCE